MGIFRHLKLCIVCRLKVVNDSSISKTVSSGIVMTNYQTDKNPKDKTTLIYKMKFSLQAILAILFLPTLILVSNVYGDQRSCLKGSISCQGETRGSLAPFHKPYQSKTFNPFPANRSKPENKQRLGNRTYSEIISRSFKRINHTTGEWSGIVQGSGVVSLYLKITEGEKKSKTNQKPSHRRKLGEVTLRGKPSSFRARAPIPKSQNWNWEIESSATPLQ